jgi:hypothetical protein
MKIEGDLKLAITRIEEQTDFDGNLFFKCKGFSTCKAKTKTGRNVRAYNQFSTIRLYPCDNLQYTETKERLFSQTTDKPVLNIVAYKSDITTPYIQGKLCCLLVVDRYDFARNKLYKKRDLLNKGE